MTAFTLVHTGLSVLPVGFGLAAFLKHGSISTATRLGRLYAATMLAATVSSFGFLFTVGFTPGQVLTLLTLALLLVGSVSANGHWRRYGYTQAMALSTSYLLLLVFATTETLKKVPVSQPFATGPNDPSLIPVRLVLLALFALAIVFQVRKIHHSRVQLASA